MVVGEYSSTGPNPEDTAEADVRAEMGAMSKEAGMDYDQEKVEQKLTEPGFFKYAEAKVKKESGVALADYLQGNDAIEKMSAWAIEFDSKVKPVLDRFKSFLSTEFVGKMKIFKEGTLNQANEAIESFLGEKAATEADFVTTYEALFQTYDKSTQQVKQINDALKKDYPSLADFSKDLDPTDLTEVAAKMNENVKGLRQTKIDNETKHSDAMDKISEQRGNNWSRFKNAFWSLGKIRGSKAEIAENKGYDKAQKNLDGQIEELTKASADIAGKAAEKTQFSGKIVETRQGILDSIKGLDALRNELTVLAAKAILPTPSGRNRKFDTQEAADTLDEMSDLWSGDPAFDSQMVPMLTEVYRREVQASADTAKDAKAVDKNRLAVFNAFLARNVSNSQAKEVMKNVLEAAIAAETDKNSPKAVQLTLMYRRTTALK